MKKYLIIFGLLAFCVIPKISQAADNTIWILETGGENTIYTLLQEEGYDISKKTQTEVEAGIPDSVDLFIFPGSINSIIITIQSSDLQSAIREYVENGGNFLGSCGGSVPGAVDLTFDLGTISMVGLAQVNAYDYFSWPSALYSDNFDFTDNELNGDYAGTTNTLTYTGGPAFDIISGNEDEIEVLATFSGNVPGHYDTTGKPAIITTSYGSGKVVLAAPHPENNENTKFLFLNLIDWSLDVPISLNAPENLTNNEKKVHKATLSWDTVENADSYNVSYYKASSPSEITTVSTSTNNVELTGLKYGAKYYWKVRALYEAGTSTEVASSWSDEHRLVTYPRAVKKAEFTFPRKNRGDTSLQAKIETMSKRITGFNVLVFEKKSGKWEKIKVEKIKNKPKNKYSRKYIEDLNLNTKYKLRVKARRKIGPKKFLSQNTDTRYIRTLD
ncbi:MAG: BPL-N domain-containing protein [Patescibacteria group bacterium]